jgi:UDP-N-acetyl-D-mannosaminuronate dehydrogenase
LHYLCPHHNEYYTINIAMKEFKDIKIAVAGTGYVGLSIATLLAQHHHVTAVDVVPEKVEKLNKRISPIQDEYIEKYLAEKPLDMQAKAFAVGLRLLSTARQRIRMPTSW